MEWEPPKMRLADLNLICTLCCGHYIGATTIVECLHSFCKSCIVKHITTDNVENHKETGKKRSSTDKFCPICEVQLHKTKPLLSLRPDVNLQRLVYKAVPGLYANELLRRREFYDKPDLQGSDRAKADHQMDLMKVRAYDIHLPEDTFSICLEYCDSARNDDKMTEETEDEDSDSVMRRYLRCPAAFTVQNMKKFLRMKFELTVDDPVEIYYRGKKKRKCKDGKLFWNEALLDDYSLIDVAYIYDWDSSSPMKFGFQILKRHIVVKATSINRVVVAESSVSSSLEEMAMQSTGGKNNEDQRTEQTGQMRDLRLGKKKLRENSDNVSEETSVPAKRARSDTLLIGRRKSAGNDRTYLYDVTESIRVNKGSEKDVVSRGQEIAESMTVEDSNDTSDFSLRDVRGEVSQATSPGGTEESAADIVADEDAVIEEEVSQAAQSVEEDQQDVSQDIEEVVIDLEGEPSQEFILQEEQGMDVSEDLEEDDDEDRLRICDPEEVQEDRISEENVEEDHVEESSVQPEVEEEKVENYIGEDTEVVRKEGKTRRKNKKAKHHHRHKRDYSPAPEATIVSSDDKTDSLKLKVKITRCDSETNQGKNRSKHDENSKYYKLNDGHSSPRQSKHKTYAVSEQNDNNSEQSLSHLNVDEDSLNSHSTDDHEVRSVSSSKEGHDDVSHPSKGTTLQNGNLESKTKNRELSNKEKLLQMRQVRHKNITPPPSRAPLNTTISKVSAEEANKNSHKTPILLTSPSPSLTVSKVTAEEKMKMMTNNNLESKRPSLEIIMVNNPNTVNKTNDNKSFESQIKQKNLSDGFPVVKLMKNNHLNSLLPKQNSLSLSKVKCTNVDISKKNCESMKNSKDDKIGADKRIGDKKGESFGALDLSGKSTRSSCSSPASEGSNSPSPSHPVLSVSQPLINRHLTMNSPHRSSSNSPPVTASVPKGSPTRPMQHPAHLWNLMTLSDTAAQVRNAQPQEGLKRQFSLNQKKPSPQRYPSIPSPGKSPSRASPTQLKIPTPNLASKFINRAKFPTTTPLPNRPVGVNKPIVALTRHMPSVSPARSASTFPNMMQSHSAAVAKKQADINGRNLNIPPPPPAIPISTLYKMEKMARKFDLDKIARGISAANKAAAGISSLPKGAPSVPGIPSS